MRRTVRAMEMVNGFACQTCADVSLAKRGVNPAKPAEGPVGADGQAGLAQQSSAAQPQARALVAGAGLRLDLSA